MDQKAVPNNPIKDRKEIIPLILEYKKTSADFHDDSLALQPTKRYISLWWITELIFAVVSLAALCCLIATLRYFDHSEVQTLPLRITLNSLIAALSTITRIALMVPVGSAVSQGAWIWFSARDKDEKGYSTQLADFETFDSASRGVWGSLTLLWRMKCRPLASLGAALTILSLVFDIFTQQVVNIEFDNVLRTNSRDAVAGIISRTDSYSDYDHGNVFADVTPTQPMTAAIGSGILAQNISYLPVFCSTGNCTWPIIPTIAVCGGCQIQGFNSSCTDDTCTLKKYTLADGTTIHNIPTMPSDPEELVFQVSPSQGQIYRSPSTPYIANFDAIGAPLGETTFTNLTAWECALWFCVQAYNITVHNSNTTQSLIGSWSEANLTDNDNYTFTSIPEYFNVLPNNSLSVSYFSVMGIQSALSNYFNGSAIAADGTQYTSDYIEALYWGSEDLNTTITRIALSMTNAVIKDEAKLPYSRYQGLAIQYVGFIQVRWLWLTLPIVLVFSSILLLVLSMIQTRRSQVPAWKSNLLVVLFTGIDASIKSRGVRNIEEYDGLKKAVGGLKVVLRRDGGNWAFVPTL